MTSPFVLVLLLFACGILIAVVEELRKLRDSLGGLRLQVEQLGNILERMDDRLYQIASNTNGLPPAREEWIDDLIRDHPERP